MNEATATQEPVGYQIHQGAATIALTNPQRRNVLTADAIAQMREYVQVAIDDESVRVIVLTGSGNTFCAGADLSGAAQATDGSFANSGPMALVGLLEAIWDCPKPTIAKVQGHVAGGGNGLVAVCDFAIAQDGAKFAFSEVRVGVAPAVISVPCLAKMNRADAVELLLTGERVSAERVCAAGLVTSVVPLAELDDAITSLVSKLQQGGPQALKVTKELLRTVPTLARTEAFAWTAEVSAQMFSSPEAQAGMTAFLTKQPAPWVIAE